ncbi:MAG: hypothetical protein R3E41_12410 [Burkholderiaceae bacterium]
MPGPAPPAPPHSGSRSGWWFVAGVAWLYVSMHRYGGMPAPIAALALLLFGAYLALFPAAVCALAMRAAQVAASAPGAAAAVGMVFAGGWALAEIARGYLFTGFPWLAIGYAHVDGPLAALAPLAGVYGVCALAALSAYGIGALAASTGRDARGQRLHSGSQPCSHSRRSSRAGR